MNVKHCSVFFMGLGCGAAIAALMAPKSGADLRSDITNKVAAGQRAVKDKIYGTAEVVDHTLKEGVAAFNEAREVYLNT
jgi:gas vesicle protein